MSAAPSQSAAPLATPDSGGARWVRVWDVPTRALHWLLAASVLGAWLLADAARAWHTWLGYLAMALVLARTIRGLLGRHPARFADFVPSPRVLAAYMAALWAGSEKRCIGHNPAGAVMVVALLALVAAAGMSGWMLTTDWGFGSDAWNTAHAWTVDALMLAVALHVLGVMHTSWRHRENLVAAMLHGRKRALDEGASEPTSAP